MDGALAVGFAVATWVWVANESVAGMRSLDALGVVLIFAVCLPLTLRRRLPCTVLVVSCAAAITFHVLGYHLGQNNIPPLVALYTVAAHRPLRFALACWVVQAAEWMHASTTAELGPPFWALLGQEFVVGSLVLAFGTTARRLALATRRVKADQADLARLAIVQERARIARELHDIVAHHMSVISVQAGLARYVLRSDPDVAHEALATIADVGAEALGEMRRLLSVLRIDNDDDAGSGDGPDADRLSAPGLADLDTLTGRIGSAGVQVEVTVEGEPRPLPPGMDLCAYRIVQECLTNVLKHAGPTRARVRLRYAATSLEIRVTDDGSVHKVVHNSYGHGLIGLTERVKLYQGSITMGPRSNSGYEVVAVLPVRPAEDGQLLKRTGARFNDQGTRGG